MFKNIFPNESNRLVYKGGAPKQGPVEFGTDSIDSKPGAPTTHVDAKAAAKARAEEVRKQGLAEAAAWGQNMGSMAVRAEVREARMNNVKISAAEVKDIIKTIGGEKIAAGKEGAPIDVDTKWVRFDDLSELGAYIIDHKLANNVSLINNLAKRANPVALSQVLGDGARVLARKVDGKVRYYLLNVPEIGGTTVVDDAPKKKA